MPAIGHERLLTACIFTMAVSLMSAAQAEQSSANGIREITLERTACFGRCPQYRVIIHNDGAVTYTGIMDVKETGKKALGISRDDVESLRRKLRDIRFFDLKDKYESLKIGDVESGGITDVPSCIVGAVTEDGRTKTVEDRWGGPKGLYELEQMIDRVINVTALTGKSPSADDLLYYDEFPFHRTLKLRGIVEGARHDFSPNAANPATFYIFQLRKNYLTFELQTAPGDLASFDGWVVDATGKLAQRGQSHDYVFIANHIQRLRRWHADTRE